MFGMHSPCLRRELSSGFQASTYNTPGSAKAEASKQAQVLKGIVRNLTGQPKSAEEVRPDGSSDQGLLTVTNVCMSAMTAGQGSHWPTSPKNWHACMQAGSELHGIEEPELQSKMRDLVRHIRDRKLRMTFTDTLGQASMRSIASACAQPVPIERLLTSCPPRPVLTEVV